MGIEILKTLLDIISYDWVGGDSIYGNSLTLRGYLYSQKQPFVLDVSEKLGVYTQMPNLYIPEKKKGKGRPVFNYRCDARAVLIKDLVNQIGQDQWQIITHRQGTKGPLIRKAAVIDVYIWKPEQGKDVGSLQLIVSTEMDGSEIKYSLCYDPTSKMPPQVALSRQMQRYFIERAFQNAKEQLGLHQYQVRSWKAWYHHVALTLMALHFILEVQQESSEEIPLISVPDIKLIFAKKLINKLNTDEGIMNALRIRHFKRKKDLDKRAKVPK